ncbi:MULTISPECIES: ferredoxin--NADP reductase [unclassified Streptomyces]|uniref:ferredoxin--NADP reductase n=1 Tax=unclassified Streptomyces TaxID=2593676 RepID=UPI000C270ED4|nr:ferredoxin--NADP reductase [Streptomyces sp. CB02959]PJN39042.1 3-ketosteroid-9-alpha-hydroxylase [Streptomyces sp. CB02959]
MPEPRIHRLRIAEVIDETADARSLVFEPHPQLPYVPGQFLTFKLPGREGGAAARCYSLASSPHTGEPMKVTVKRVPGGHGSNWLCDHARPGTELEVLPPAGTFTPAGLDTDLLLIAGGSGITPVMSVLKSALTQGTARHVLLYANRSESAVIFRGELRELAEDYPDRLVVLHWLESLQGMPDPGRLAAVLAPHVGREAYLCGPQPLMDAAEQALRGLGAPRGRLHRERFFSLSGAAAFEAVGPVEPPEAVEAVEANGADRPGGPARPDAGAATTLTVELDGETHQVRWPVGTPLLDALLAAGVDAPYSCREGACAACTCRVVSGEVAMAHNEVLDAEDLAEGYVLACQAVATGGEVEISYS